MKTDGRTLRFERDGETHLALVVEGDDAPRSGAMTITDEAGLFYAISIPLGEIPGYDANYIARRYPSMLCRDCGREVETHASGLCDSCETQARYDDVSATPAERVLALLDDLGVDPSTRRIVEAAVVPLTDEERHEANLISIREEIGYGSALQRVRAGRVPPRAYLIAAYDVSDLTEDEIEALAGEVCAQADRSDGHGSVEMVIDSIRGDASPGYIGHIETPTGEGMIISAVAAPGPDPVPSLAEAALADARRSS